MEAHFVISRATKAQLQVRVRELTQAYNDVARRVNALSDEIVPFTADEDIRKGDTVVVRVPKRFMVSNA